MTAIDTPPADPQKTRSRTPGWAKFLLVLFVILAIAAAAVGGVWLGRSFGASEQREIQVIKSVELQEQVVLVRSAIADLKPKADIQDINGIAIPWTDRSVLLQYEFDTMVGINGEDITITRTGDNAFRIAIPDFILIGIDEPRYLVVNEANGVLSFLTPEIDTLKLTEEVLTDEVKAEHIEGLRPVLEVQAKDFYTNIITAIDPDVILEFTFAE